MSASSPTQLPVEARTENGSRETRRLRRRGYVPGIVYGGDGEPAGFQIQERTLRHALAEGGAVIELSIDGATAEPVVLKDLQRHPVNGATMHIDLHRVNLNVAIQATVVLELTGVEDAPGVKDGGVLEQVTRELTVEALPTAIPDSLSHDVSAMEMNDTLMLDAISAPEGVVLVDDDETVIATLAPPRLSVESDDEIETETELVGEDGAEGEASGEDGGDAAADSGSEDSGE